MANRTKIEWMPWNNGDDAPQNGEPILVFIPEIGPKKVKFQYGAWFDGFTDFRPEQIAAWTWYNDPDPAIYDTPAVTIIETGASSEPSEDD